MGRRDADDKLPGEAERSWRSKRGPERGGRDIQGIIERVWVRIRVRGEVRSTIPPPVN